MNLVSGMGKDTLNVRGLKNVLKRAAMFHRLASSAFQLCFLQEVHLQDQQDVAVFSSGWRKGRSYWNVGGVHSKGVGILFGERSFENVSTFTGLQGRV
uniref:Uncharacterized protein n=1 Tax=Scleropages formosus TaxID=113540 RepID=A0A8C9WD04_SCLFO